MIYLDNAATSYPKPQVIYDEMLKCMKEYCANPGRGGHYMALASLNAITEAREAICKFFNIKNSLNICFTKNATEALNIAIKGLLKENDHIITTTMEHNSVSRPLNLLQNIGKITISTLKSDSLGQIDVEDIKSLINKNTRVIISTLSSNVNGIIMPVKEMGKIAKELGILFLLDASQGAGAIDIDVEQLNVDLMAFPGHKGLLGPQGTGGLYVKEGITLNPLIEGGTGSNSESLFQPQVMPDMLESGTLNTPGIVGLKAGINYINEIGIENIRKHKSILINRLIDGIKELKSIEIYSKKEIENNSGIVAFNFKDVDSTEVSYVLDKIYNIATRAGLHCSPAAHRTLGTIDSGVVRVSVGYFNTLEEIDFTLKALKEISINL